jgi:hypothetical protein
MSVPTSASRDPLTADVGCFCGEGVERSDPEHIRLDARWAGDAGERQQSWGAHRRCLVEQMHEAVRGQGAFFDDD